MPKIFWLGLAVMYGWFFLFVILEWTVPGFPLKKFLGIPACYIYNVFLGVYVINIIVAWSYAHWEEIREAKLESGTST